MLTCDVCGKLHPAGTLACDVCGTSLATWPYIATSDLGQELGLDRLPPESELGRGLVAPLRELSGALCAHCRQTNRPGATFCAHCGHTLVAPPTGPLAAAAGQIAPGTPLGGHYRVLRRVAQGGMGAVYEAEDLETPGTHWALKEMVQTAIAPEDRTQALKDFMREATLLATLAHPNLPRFNGIFSEEGKHYLVMEFIPGQTLEQVIGNTGAFLPETRVLGWAAQLCAVLAYLHAQDPPIIYRDMKPGNIMLPGDREQIKLIDFGIARFHRRGRSTDTAAFGTAGYAPPEQYGNGQTDQRSDVYALAATLHHLLSGHDPVQNPFHWRPVRAYNPHVSRQVDQAIMRALELKPELRYATIDTFARALGLVADAARVPTVPATARPGRPRPPLPTAPVPAGPVLPRPIPAVPEPALAAAAAANSAPTMPVPVLAGPAAPVPTAGVGGPQLTVSEKVIELGPARQARKGRRVNLLNAGPGQLKGIVRVTQPWLAVSAVQFQGNVGELTVSARRRGLRFARQAAPVPRVFGWARRRLGTWDGRWTLVTWLVLSVLGAGLLHQSPTQGLLAGFVLLLSLLAGAQVWFWLVARHVRWLVPAPLVNTGEVLIDSNGGRQRVEVRVLARPSWVRRAVAWLVCSALLLLELLLVGGALLGPVLGPMLNFPALR